MNEEMATDAQVRQFLLGKVDDEVREQIQNLFLTDLSVRERVLHAEQDLIEDYLEDALTSEDKQRFEFRYAQTPAQQRRLRITKSIKDWAANEAAASLVAANQDRGANVTHEDRSDRSDSLTSTNSIWDRLRLRPMFVLPIAAVTVLAVVLGIIWIDWRREQGKHFAIEQELARLNSPESLREVPAGLQIVDLRPYTLRSADTPRELPPLADDQLLELRLPIRNDEYPGYQTVVRRLRDNQSFTVRDLRSDTTNGKTIRLRLPGHLLTRGTYQIQLTGVTTQGTAGPSEEYQFTVGE